MLFEESVRPIISRLVISYMDISSRNLEIDDRKYDGKESVVVVWPKEKSWNQKMAKDQPVERIENGNKLPFAKRQKND